MNHFCNYHIVGIVALSALPSLTLFPLPTFRKQYCWAWSCSGAAGRSPSNWRVRCRNTIWPQEPPRRKVQSCSWLSLCTPPFAPRPSLTSAHLWHVFLQMMNPWPFVSPTGILPTIWQTAVSSTSPSALFWYLFLENRFVLFLLVVCFDRSTLCISSFTVGSLPFFPPVTHQKGSRITFDMNGL